MPIPDGGPVSLITPGETQAQIKPPSKEAGAGGRDRQESPDIRACGGMGEKEEAAVALLAESLALTAASAMDEEELETARRCRFRKAR